MTAVAAAAAWLFLRDPIRLAWRDELLHRAIRAADAGASGKMTPRLAARSTLMAGITVGGTTDPADAARALLKNAVGDKSPEGLHASAVALLLRGNTAGATRLFRTALSQRESPSWLSDLAAAELLLGDKTSDPEHYVAALAACDKALVLAPELPEAHFNRAIVIERLGFGRAAIGQWRKAQSLDGASKWAKAMAAHLDELTRRKSARDELREAEAAIASLSPAVIERLATRHPQEARLWGLAFLPEWSRRYLAAENGDAYLTAARLFGDRLAATSGERLLHDVVAEIDAARTARDGARLAALAQAHLAYVGGRIAFSKGLLDEAGLQFAAARDAFAAAGSAMDEVTEFYAALNAIRTNRMADARASLVALRGRAAARPGHESTIAYADHHIALVDAMNGRWGDALERATSARDRFARLGERGNAGEADMIIGDVVAFLGQPHLARKHLVAAATAFSAAGMIDRLQICAAELSYLEMRRRSWASAVAITRIELTLGNDPEIVTHSHLRISAAALADRDRTTAEAAIRDARKAAAATASDETQQRLFADIGAVEGRILTASNPAAAVTRLSESIAFQSRVERAFTLPELYLQRGRAYLVLGARNAALGDFERGIGALELQRSRVRDYVLRAGLFDDARELFSEAVSVSLRNGDVPGAFRYLERARARALLDELGERAAAPVPASVTEIQKSVASEAALVSYAVLPDRVAIFVLTANRIEVRYGAVRGDDLARQVRDYVRTIKARREGTALASSLYDALLRPIGDVLARTPRIVIVPDAVLEQLPFAALFDRRTNTYLVESHETLLIPSVSVFIACMRRANADDAPPRSIAIFANPDVPVDRSLPPLRAAEKEASAVAGQYPRPLVLRRAEATAARFREEAPRYDLVQFSGHARVNGAEPWKSALMLDENLSARDIATIRFRRTRVVILAACSTMSASERSEDTSPIAKAFLMSGVPAVIGSLWDIDDSDAAAATVRLHARLARGVSAAAAVRDIQREMLHDRTLHHPAAWAAFTVLGADRGVMP